MLLIPLRHCVWVNSLTRLKQADLYTRLKPFHLSSNNLVVGHRSVLSSNQMSTASTQTMSSTQLLMNEKRQMREEMTKKLSALTESELKKSSSHLMNQLIQHPTYLAAKAVGLFLSMPTGEIQTEELIIHALQAGKIVFVPRIDPPTKKQPTASSSSTPVTAAPSVHLSPPPSPPPSRMRMLQLSSFEDLSSFVANRWGIREPPLTQLHAPDQLRLEAAQCDDLSLIVCPGVAFDHDCRRLGHGKGYYDSYLASLRQIRLERGLTTHLATIGIGLDEQIVPAVPVGETDVRLDEIMTPNKHFKASS